MEFAFRILALVTFVTAEKAVFELEIGFNDLNLFQEITLGPPSTYTQPEECARKCVRSPSCSMFSFNQAAATCQLYGDVVYPDLYTASQLLGEMYYTYRTDWCPLNNQFFMFRSVNMCVKIPTDVETYDNAGLKCEEYGARLVVLEDEDKATAVTNLLENKGLKTTMFFLGADDRNTEGAFVWADGRQMTRQWWYPTDPNNLGGEDCVFIRDGAIFDYHCSEELRYICEIAN